MLRLVNLEEFANWVGRKDKRCLGNTPHEDVCIEVSPAVGSCYPPGDVIVLTFLLSLVDGDKLCGTGTALHFTPGLLL